MERGLPARQTRRLRRRAANMAALHKLSQAFIRDQMMRELPGPMFWHLDGCNMDDDFAFSFHCTREEWEAEQREREEFSRRWRETDWKQHEADDASDPFGEE